MKSKPIINNPQPDWSEMGLWEYMLVANPDEIVKQKIKEEKQSFYNEYKTEIAIKTEPHITIANFLAKEMMEETLCRWTQRICDHQQSFTVALNNYSGFPSHAIYIRVQNPQPFKQLANSLKTLETFIQDNHCPPLQLVNKPHMTIARQLSEDVYNKAIISYAQKTFHELFTLNKLVLLKRSSRYKKWEHVTVFTLPPERNLFN
jgi:2'-5' RNA ligase